MVIFVWYNYYVLDYPKWSSVIFSNYNNGKSKPRKHFPIIFLVRTLMKSSISERHRCVYLIILQYTFLSVKSRRINCTQLLTTMKTIIITLANKTLLTNSVVSWYPFKKNGVDVDRVAAVSGL